MKTGLEESSKRYKGVLAVSGNVQLWPAGIVRAKNGLNFEATLDFDLMRSTLGQDVNATRMGTGWEEI